jgi:hypothetical protein
MMAEARLCARKLTTFIEATREMEVKAMLKLGRDSIWPLRITTASLIVELTSRSVTYEIDWEGIKWEDDKQSVAWCRKKFTEAATADGMKPPPALQRRGLPWNIMLRKENNSSMIILRENTRSTREEPGEPAMILYAPRTVVKFRSVAPDAKERLINCIYTLYL